MAAVRDDKAQSRFELDVEGAVAFANYRVTPSAVIITHTETPRSLRGRGIASELVKGALELIRADGRKVVAGCSFVVDYLAAPRGRGFDGIALSSSSGSQSSSGSVSERSFTGIPSATDNSLARSVASFSVLKNAIMVAW